MIEKKVVFFFRPDGNSITRSPINACYWPIEIIPVTHLYAYKINVFITPEEIRDKHAYFELIVVSLDAISITGG